jgi:hypothetical protein
MTADVPIASIEMREMTEEIFKFNTAPNEGVRNRGQARTSKRRLEASENSKGKTPSRISTAIKWSEVLRTTTRCLWISQKGVLLSGGADIIQGDAEKV